MSRDRKPPVDVTKELSHLKHPAKRNTNLPKLPANVTFHKRPINHAPTASPFAGAGVPKIVYVSRKTPVMSAVKRVKTFLKQIEKRALQSANVDGVLDKAGSRRVNDTGDQLHRKLEEVSAKIVQKPEEVLVKASGRAMEQALRIAEWFRNRETEIMTKIEVRTGSTSVVDDLVEKDEDQSPENGEELDEKQVDVDMDEGEMGETTLKIVEELKALDEAESIDAEAGTAEVVAAPQKRKRKRKRKQYDVDDVPEARIRWIKTIEIAITLRA